MSRSLFLSAPKFLIVVLMLSTSSCSTAGDLGGAPCASNKKSVQWLGQSFSQALENLGAYSSEDEFDLRDTFISEFRGNLEVLFPDSTSDSQPVWIKEISWVGEVCVRTLWLKKNGDIWIVVDHLSWVKNSDF